MTVSVTVVEWLRLPLVPVMVSGKLPVCGCPPPVTVSVLELVVDDGLKLALTPWGRPVTLRLTLPVKPPDGAMVTVLDVLDFAVSDRVEGDALSEKSPLPPELCTTSVTLVEWFSVPSLPVTVRV